MPNRHAVLLVRAALPVPEETAAKSYLGGLPRMPDHLAWPVETFFDEQRALTFVAQVALSEIPEFPQRHLLPSRGTLYFFVSSDFDGRGDPTTAVLYFEGDATNLPVVAPPDNLMLLAGDLYYYSRFWLDGARDLRAKVEFKYPVSFVVTESYPESEPARQIEAWQAALGAPSNQDIRALHKAISPEDDAWPFNWATLEHLARALAVTIERDPWRFERLSAESVSAIREIARAARAWAERATAADAFAPLSAERAAEFRTWWRAQRDPVKRIAREVGAYAPNIDRAFVAAVRYAVRLTVDAGTGASELIPPHYLRSVQAETLWLAADSTRLSSVHMPMHQMFGFGERVQNAPIEHADDVLLLQIKGDEGLAWHENVGCALQLWVSGNALQALRFEEVQATLECD